ncbi:MAG: AAA family ATPase [Clostridia bacterium]|nr:AAA family ATPase [Clostridia bacterium]
MVRDAIIGMLAAAALFCLAFGYDVTPVIMAGGLIALFELVSSGQMLGRKFEVVEAAKAGSGIARVTFGDVGGQESAKRELVEALEFIRNEESAIRLGIRPLRGILLSGPPGTGKTLLARAAANYTDAVFFATAGSQFIEMYAGVGAKRVRELFSGARRSASAAGKRNAVVFIDEIDVLGGVRGKHDGHLEYDQTLNQLLVEMDGLSAASRDGVRVLVIGATNRADLLDPALMRPGRFDRMVSVGVPDKEGRRRILEIHTKRKPLADDVDLDRLAGETFGFSGAHLESLANEAAIMALRSGRATITMADFSEAIEKVIMGERIGRKPEEEELLRVAVHEVGHACVSEILRPGSVASVTVSSRGKALGYVRHSPRSDTYLQTGDELAEEMAVLLAGAVSEELVLGARSSGASQDIEQAISTARKMVNWGLSDLGIISEPDIPRERYHDALTGLVRREESRAKSLLCEFIDFIRSTAKELASCERMEGDEFRERMARAGENAGQGPSPSLDTSRGNDAAPCRA